MSRFIKLLGATVVAAFAGLAATAAQATPLITYCITLANDACVTGTFTESAPAPSPINVSNISFQNFTISLSAFADPTIPQPDFNTTNQDASLGVTALNSVANGTVLHVWLTATGLTFPQGVNTFESSFTSNQQTNLLNVVENAYLDASNAAFGTGTSIGTATFTHLQISDQFNLSPNLSGPFSETELYTITVNCGSATSCGVQGLFTISTNLINTPEPLTLSLFGAGLAGMGAIRRRRKAAV